MNTIILEEELTTKERNSLQSKQFGLPKERKYPLNDAAHVKSAISYFYKCPEKDRAELAKNIEKAAKRFNVEIGSDTEVAKYLNIATEEYFTDVVTEMVLLIEDSDSRIVIEQTKLMTLLKKIGKAILSGLSTIARLILKGARILIDKFITTFKKLAKIGDEYVDVPKCFDRIETVVTLAETISSSVMGAINILSTEFTYIENNIENSSLVAEVISRTEPWRGERLTFMKNTNLLQKECDLSFSDKAVKETRRIPITQLTKIELLVSKTITALNESSDEVSECGKTIQSIWDDIEYNYDRLLIDYSIRKKFNKYATDANALIATAIQCLAISISNLGKIGMYIGTAVIKRQDVEDEM